MLRSKTVTSKIFPMLEGIPKEIIGQHFETTNDGALLFEPSRFSGGMASYHCLKCGNHGKQLMELPICPHCGNNHSRPFQKGYPGDSNRKVIRFVQVIDEMILIRDFLTLICETEENGAERKYEEHIRICIKGSDMLAFSNFKRYNGGGYEHYWQKTDRPYTGAHCSIRLICSLDVLHHPLYNVMKEILLLNADKAYEQLKIIVAGANGAELITLPKVDFQPDDYSLIKEKGNWTARLCETEVEGTTQFSKQRSWCTNCGKYFERVKETRHTYSLENAYCLACGNSAYSPHTLSCLVDAVIVPDKSVVLRIACINKHREFGAALFDGVDPVVDLKHDVVFVNYILINQSGEVNFCDENKQSIDKLQIAAKTDRNHTCFYYTEQAKKIISESRAVARTGFNLCFDHDITPKYFEKLKQIPCLEIFAKFGFDQLVADIVQKDVSEIPAYFRKDMKDSRLGKLTKPQIKSMRESVVTLKHLVSYMQVLNRDKDALYAEFYELAMRAHERHILDILRVGIPDMNVSKIKEYITHVDDFQCCPPNESMQLWSDYLRMLRDAECDLTDQKLVYTNSLKREHDKMSRKVTQIKNEKLSAEFEERSENNEWLEYKDKTLTSVIPRHLSELYEEGRRLNHCVGLYASRIVDGETVIVFLRQNSKPESPYCTVEVRGKKIVQARGYSNREGKLIPGVADFLTAWAKEKDLIIDVA